MELTLLRHTTAIEAINGILAIHAANTTTQTKLHTQIQFGDEQVSAACKYYQAAKF